jgi:hypothetical protein
MLSADYPGKIVERISDLTNRNIDVVFFNGSAGDLNPITTCGTNYQKLEHDKSLIYGQFGTYIHTKKIGYAIADEALKLVKSIPESDYVNDLEFQFFFEYFWIPLKDFKYFSKAWFRNKLHYFIKKFFLMKVARITLMEANFPAFVIKKSKMKIQARTTIQFIRLIMINSLNYKSIGIIAVPGELFEDYGDLLVKKSPTGEDYTFIFQNSNDWISYLFPVREYIEEGGYEPLASFSPICGYIIKNKMLELFKSSNNKSF